MHGDFSLNPLNYRDRVSRVLYQMGRVQLDSDANEQTESTLHFLRGLGEDVIGYHGAHAGGFRITEDAAKKSFRVGWGEYYVDGIRCVNLPFTDIWDFIGNPQKMKDAGDGAVITDITDSWWDPNAKFNEPTLLYLAVWERHISAAENDEIREVALNGPDTASRAEVVWQIRATRAEPILQLARKLRTDLGLPAPGTASDPNSWKVDPVYLALNLTLRSSAKLKAFAKENQDMEPCTISPEARYRGGENRLYRVEIHHGGGPDTATFKWSPDNAAIVYPVREIEGTTVFLESLGRDERTAIMKNDWVEIVDDKVTLTRKDNALVQVIDVNRHRMTVTLSAEPENNAGSDRNLRPILRRWADEAQPVKLGTDIDLDEGVKVQFSVEKPPNGNFRAGDYWLIPARPATGDVIWPGGTKNPLALRPHGIDEHYAPLALHDPAAAASEHYKDFRWRFRSIADPVTPFT